MFKKLSAALIAASFLAAPVQANPATALSLSRAGETVAGESNLTGLPVGTWFSLAAVAVGLYFSIAALLPEEEPESA